MFLMDTMENHRVENDKDSDGQAVFPLDMLRFLSKHLSKHRNTVMTFISSLFLKICYHSGKE